MKGKEYLQVIWDWNNIQWEQVQWCSLCVILTSTVGVDSCVNVCNPDAINKLIITNATDGITGKKGYPTDENLNFWLI